MFLTFDHEEHSLVSLYIPRNRMKTILVRAKEENKAVGELAEE